MRATTIERAYRLLVEVGHALRLAAGEAELAQEICGLAVQHAGYRLAWVGYRELDGSFRIRPVAQHGFDDGYLDRAEIRWDESPRGVGPSGTAIRTGEPQVAQNIATDPRFIPWRSDALERGYSASCALPLLDRDECFGVLNVYAPEPDSFGSDEIELLRTVAVDLSHGLLAARGKRELTRLQAGLGRLDQLDSMARSAAMFAHDMNNHLSVVRLSLEQIALGDETTTSKALHDAHNALDRAIAMNRRIAKLAKPDEDAVTVFSVDQAVTRTESEYRQLLGPGIELELELRASECHVRMDRTSLEGILANLIVNARDALSRRGHVRLETRPLRLAHPIPARYLGVNPGAFVSVRISDDGPGIPNEIRTRIFEPFFSTKGAMGTGLGLASVHATVRGIGGAVALDSAPGTGTTFEVILPAVDAGC